MTYRVFYLLLFASLASASELVIPNQKPGGWVPHHATGTGVLGGYDQYRPGGASERTVLRSVVTVGGADPTGATLNTAEFTTALAAVGNNEVLYIPPGLFRVGGITMYDKSNFTIRGAGAPVKATDTHTIGTGTKTFTVPDSMPWTAGVGVRVWIHQDEGKWMQGTVTSYVGTTLTLNITSTSGSGSSSLWMISVSHIIAEAGAPFVFTSQAPYGRVDITGSPALGASTITVSDAGAYSIGNPVTIDILNGDGQFNMQYFVRSRRMQNVVTAISGNTMTLAVPLMFNCPSSLVPQIVNQQLHNQKVGFEDFSISQDATNENAPLTISSAYQCWVHNVHVRGYSHGLWLSEAVRCEVFKLYSADNAHSDSIGNIIVTATTACLIQHSVFGNNYRDYVIYSQGNDMGDLWQYNNGGDGKCLICHDPYPSFNLFQYNVFSHVQSDGFYGGTHAFTHFRNYLHGEGADSTPSQFIGWLIHGRGSYYVNAVGNILGSTTRAGGKSWGNPTFSGENPNASNNVLAYIDGGRTDSSLLPRHLDEIGEPRITGTVSSQDSESMTITLNGGKTMAEFAPPFNVDHADYRIMSLRWGPGREGHHLINLNFNFTESAVEGSTLVLHISGGYTVFQYEPTYDNTVTSENFPANGTVVRLHPFAGGRNEQDFACLYSATVKANLVANGSGGSAIDTALGAGVTLPDSLAGAPTWWPSSMTMYPINPFAGLPASDAVLVPAQYYALNAEWPAESNVAMPSFSPPAGQYDATQSVTITAADAIYYTTNGATPDNTSATYSVPVPITSTTTLKAVAYDGVDYSSVRTGVYRLKAATPYFSLGGGTYASPQTVTFTVTAGSTTYYTTNGSTPNTGSSVYSTPITITPTQTLKAYSVKSGLEDSDVATAIYTLSVGGPVISYTPGQLRLLRR